MIAKKRLTKFKLTTGVGKGVGSGVGAGVGCRGKKQKYTIYCGESRAGYNW